MVKVQEEKNNVNDSQQALVTFGIGSINYRPDQLHAIGHIVVVFNNFFTGKMENFNIAKNISYISES